jgi:hypothetical protein
MGIIGLGYELTSIDFGKRTDRYEIDTEKYPGISTKNGASLLLHHSNGKIEWNPKKFKLLSAEEIFRDCLTLNGLFEKELAIEKFKKINPLNATVLQYYLKNAGFFEKDRKWDKKYFESGKNIAYAGTIFSDEQNKPVILRPGIIGNEIWKSTLMVVELSNKESLSKIYCPCL